MWAIGKQNCGPVGSTIILRGWGAVDGGQGPVARFPGEACMQKTGLLISGFRHDTGNHPECSDRLRAIEEVCAQEDLQAGTERLQPRAATVDELCTVHDRDYVHRVEEACRGGIRALDPDTIISSASYEEARLAAGAVLTAIDHVIAGAMRNAFCAVRPPGHHAERDRAMGFCLFNNVAVAARYAQSRHGLRNILIVDWDVHHGNGTQNTFYADPTVFYFSLHQENHYPGTGHREQEGKDAGIGFTRNLPMAAGSGDGEYQEAFEQLLVPAMVAFKPELILISAGFDAHAEDPLAGIYLTEAGITDMTDILVRLAKAHCRGRLVSVLEGGYNLTALKQSVRAHLLSLFQG